MTRQVDPNYLFILNLTLPHMGLCMGGGAYMRGNTVNKLRNIKIQVKSRRMIPNLPYVNSPKLIKYLIQNSLFVRKTVMSVTSHYGLVK